MNICLFEDNATDDLAPMSLCRPAYAITCGAIRLVDLAIALSDSSPSHKLVAGFVRPHLVDFERDYFAPSGWKADEATIWINARLVPDAAILRTIDSAIAKQDKFIAMVGDRIALARTDATPSPPVSGPNKQDLEAALLGLTLPQLQLDVRMLDLPYQVIAAHGRIMRDNLDWRIANDHYRGHSEGVFVSGDADIHPMAVFDTSNGPIVIEDGAKIGPFAVLNGPVHIGANTRVNPHALLKGPVSIGHSCKVGGEVSSSVIEGLTNKSHYGYLGTSYVGSWVNLGAGTTNSNLKNTYGTIRLEYGERKIDTGLQFMGCVIGDYSKTAINTSIYTGKTIGVCSNVYGTVTKNVPSFANYAQSFGECTEQPAGVMEVTQKRVFDRRKATQEERHKELIHAVYAIEAPKRQLPNRPLSL